MKKSINLILSISLLFPAIFLSACNTQTVVKTNEEKYGYTAFPGTDWGMSVEECMNSLGLTEEDYTKETPLDNGEPNTTVYTANIKFMDSINTASFYFVDKASNLDYGFGLTRVSIKFTESKSIDDYNQTVEVYSGSLKEKNAHYSLEADGGGTTTERTVFRNGNSIDTIESSDIKNRAIDISYKFDSKPATKSAPNELDNIAISFYDKENPTYNGTSIIVSYTGISAAILNTAEKQLEAEKSK